MILSAGSYNSTTGGVSNSIASYPNNSLRWEKTKTTNIGIDADFLNGRVGLSFDYYLKKSSDLLAKDAIDPTTGTSSMTKMLVLSIIEVLNCLSMVLLSKLKISHGTQFIISPSTRIR